MMHTLEIAAGEFMSESHAFLKARLAVLSFR
jgi:hypothetical protein